MPAVSPAPSASAAPRPVPVAVPRPIPVAAAAPAPVMPRPIPVARAASPAQLALRETGDEESDVELKRVALKNGPPWLISCLFHLVLVVVLGLWLVRQQGKANGIFLDVSSTEIGEQLLDADSIIPLGEITDEELALTPDTLPEVDDPFAKDSSLEVSLDSETPVPDFTGPTISIALAGREEGTKKLLLGKYGGNGQTEDAVGLGLKWLARQQRKDGTWSLTGPYRDGAVNTDTPESATAMALLAFQGAGNTHQKGEFQKQVSAGIEALLKMQNSEGNFFQERGTANAWFYSHGQATIAVCELYGMTKDPRLKKPAELAIKYCLESQDPMLGGWKYWPRSASDTSVTGWVVMALQSARMAGLEVPSPVLLKIGEFLDKVSEPSGGSLYSYEIGQEPKRSMTAEGLLCRQYLGWRRDDPRLIEGVEYLIRQPPRPNDRDVYYWYYGTQVMHHMEGKYWPVWNAAMRETLVNTQEKSGLEKGSWAPQGDQWGDTGYAGRLYTTCLSLYMLEVYYRHLPIYGMKSQ
ncbi:MAG TPA: prenyltransferase/squalene oxidase repeat-containing protein [Pirellulales bacterium]|nr:prenyltransferase/squalene oxidase repeat-containing protein [Pirellulales bacterium]